MMVAVSLVLLLTVLEHANGIKTDHDPEIIEHPKDEYIGKSAYAVIRCQAKYASVMEFKCNDDWLTNHKTRDIKHWKDDNGVEHVSGSIKIKACFHFQIYFLKNPPPTRKEPPTRRYFS